MTAIKVIDASALAAFLFGEAEAGMVAEQMKGARLVAPALLDFELANVCLMKIRRHPTLRDSLRAAFRLAGGVGVETLDVDLAATLDLAAAKGLTAYDASYLWLMRTLGAELITLDRKLAAASG